jgi:hypothetical protein
MYKRLFLILLLACSVGLLSACAGQPIQIEGGVEIDPGGEQPSNPPQDGSGLSSNTLLTVGLIVAIVLLALIAGAALSNRGR